LTEVALEDWDYIKQTALKGIMNDPFIVTTEKELDRVLLKEMAQKWKETQQFGTNPTMKRRMAKLTAVINGAAGDQHHEPRDKDKWKMLKAPRHIGNKKETFELFMQRLLMAAIGGAFLVGPMLVMVLHRSVLTSLLTASLCVVAFGLTMAIYLEKPFEVLSGTAAYAAVLMVFVGTSGG
jgi:ABC-type bacteriocin/lantibiotic exporter with double-glycine peptidase domain